MSSSNSARTMLGFFIFVFVASTGLSRAAENSDVLYDLYPFVRVYKNGTVQRFIGTETVPAGLDLATGVQSKDVKFSRNPALAARLYLPAKATTGNAKLPILIYYHGGGFFTESAFSPTYHTYLNSLVAKSGVIAVSVNYRLAPEHPLPIAYADSWLALRWTVSHFGRGAGKEPWIRQHGDFHRIYLGGDSAGGNLAHSMAIRIGKSNPVQGIEFQGMFLNCPYFATKTSPPALVRLWVHAYPNSRNVLDDPRVNPGVDRELRLVGVANVIVFVAGNDPLRGIDLGYVRKLGGSGWKGRVREVEFPGEDHVFNLNQPNSSDASRMADITASFLNSSS